ncbi:MAG: 2-amino-4-hydroxy-6-hydroxymethyldihydropteridine diphosphokinase [Planctomycetaceae bacterium]
MARCLIGCGSNQGARREQLDRAIELLGTMPGIRLEAVSRHRETRPIGGPPDQPPFLNGACLIDTDLEPHDLLGLLAAVENTLHRDRSERWGPRTVDLDLLLYDDTVIDDGDGAPLTVPHPRMTTRRFVLEPAVEIAPDLRHPLSGLTLRDLLDNISRPHLHVAVVGVAGAGAPAVAEAVADATLARHLHAEMTIPWEIADVAAWEAALAAAAGPQVDLEWPPDRHGTVSDHWLGELIVAAEEALAPEALRRFAALHEAATAAVMPAHVAVFLRLSPGALAGRPDGARLARHQDRLLARLRCRSRAAAVAPPSVVVVAADDPSRAVDEAIAAVEATA